MPESSHELTISHTLPWIHDQQFLNNWDNVLVLLGDMFREGVLPLFDGVEEVEEELVVEGKDAEDEGVDGHSY